MLINEFHVLRNAYELHRLPQHINVCVMLSAGSDSIAVLHFLNKNRALVSKLFNVEKYTLKAFHFNHKLRPQNDIMQQTAIELCEHLNVPLHVKCSESFIATEQDAREQRFNAIETLVENHLLITGHHLNDCVESYLMNVFRGHEGYMPMPLMTKLTHNMITKPFLFTTKKSLNQYVKYYKLDSFIVEDETNQNTKGSRRNFIRNKIIPHLDKENMGLASIVHNKMLYHLYK